MPYKLIEDDPELKKFAIDSQHNMEVIAAILISEGIGIRVTLCLELALLSFAILYEGIEPSIVNGSGIVPLIQRALDNVKAKAAKVGLN
jgi:hypothetical protein